MNRRDFIAGAGAGLVTILLGGCSFTSQNKAQQRTVSLAASENNKKILIACFSHTGNTKAFAEIIQKEAGGDLFAIEPQAAYPRDYDTVAQQAKGEVGSRFKPALANKIAEIRSYDVIFIGTPIWWYTVAPPVRTFLAEYDLADKKVVPFSTHKGSGLSGIDKAMQGLQPKAKVLEGFAIWDDKAKEMQADIANWLQRLKISS